MESTIADADAIATDKSAGTYHRPTGREDYNNRGVGVRHGSPRLDGVRGWVRGRLSERKISYYRKFDPTNFGSVACKYGNSD